MSRTLRRDQYASPIPLNEKHLTFPIHDINIDDGAEAGSYFGIIRLNDDCVVENHDFTIPIVGEMDDNNLSKSDNLDTQLYLNVNLRVVSTVFPRDRTVTAAAQQADHR